jgi:two-component system LytT family sensor kinase
MIWVIRTAMYPIFGLGRYYYGVMTVRYPMEFFNDAIGYVIIVSILYLFDRQARAAQLEKQLAEAELANLRLQLQPHFLFNALNAICSLVYEDARKADTMIGRLGQMLRSTILDVGEQRVSLDRELETLDLYLDIMHCRFEDRLTVDVHVAPDVRMAQIPHLFLQPLVENSIRHGVDPGSQTVRLAITAGRIGNETRLQVRDWGTGLPAAGMSKGTGISNAKERLRRLYGTQQKLSFENCEDGGLLVTATFPFQT